MIAKEHVGNGPSAFLSATVHDGKTHFRSAVVRSNGMRRPSALRPAPSLSRLGGQGSFQRRELAFELLDFLARAQQHAALHVELLARDQIELAEA